MQKVIQRAISLLFVISGFCLSTFAQPPSRVIKGVVTDEVGATLPGASVMVKNFRATPTTNSKGQYSITVPEPGIII